MNQTASDFPLAYCDKAERMYLRPGNLYAWDEIITGAPVQSENGKVRYTRAVAPNTFRGFHRLSKDCAGAQAEFMGYFIEQKASLLASLRAIRRRTKFHEFSNRICEAIRQRLTNVVPKQLESYNKIRKPVDLYLEHLVTMAKELDDQRVKLVPYLFLPLDSQIFACERLFTSDELATHRLSRTSTYQEVRNEQTYEAVQTLIAAKAQNLAVRHSRVFHPIYFDLIWGHRYRNWGSNLFETIP